MSNGIRLKRSRHSSPSATTLTRQPNISRIPLATFWLGILSSTTRAPMRLSFSEPFEVAAKGTNRNVVFFVDLLNCFLFVYDWANQFIALGGGHCLCSLQYYNGYHKQRFLSLTVLHGREKFVRQHLRVHRLPYLAQFEKLGKK